MDAGTLHRFSAKELDEALLQIAAAESAVSQSLLELIQVKDAGETYRADGATSMAAWLSLKLGWSNHRASKAVKVARALSELPLTREAYAQGRICWERVEAMCCFATAETEQELLETALNLGATDLRGLLRSLKQVEMADAKQAYEQRHLHYFWDLRTRMLNLKGQLPEVEGAVFVKALEHLADRGDPSPKNAACHPHPGRNAKPHCQRARRAVIPLICSTSRKVGGLSGSIIQLRHACPSARHRPRRPAGGG